jgi:hypothetical protein
LEIPIFVHLRRHQIGKLSSATASEQGNNLSLRNVLVIRNSPKDCVESSYP